MSEFFKFEDFDFSYKSNLRESAAEQANKKLKEQGRYVYYDICSDTWGSNPQNPIDHSRALLLPAERIKKCEHPKEKVNETREVSLNQSFNRTYQCECGVKLQPETFKVVE